MSNQITQLSRQEYLKRYLNPEESGIKKKKKKIRVKPVAKKTGFRIIDDDIGILDADTPKEDEDEVGEVDEAPTVAEVIDDTPLSVKIQQQYNSDKWKKVDEHSHSEGSDDDRRMGTKFKNRHDSDDDYSPPRKIPEIRDSKNNKNVIGRHDSDSDFSPRQSEPQKQRHDSDSDASPPRRSVPSHKSSSSKNDSVRRRHDSDKDLSPERVVQGPSKKSIKRSRSDSDPSPPRRTISSPKIQSSHKNSKRKDSDSDLSPERPNSKSKDVRRNIHSPKRSNSSRIGKGSSRQDSDSDLSPERPKRRDSSPVEVKYSQTEDFKSRHKNANRQRTKKDSDGDFSPVRRSGRGESPESLSSSRNSRPSHSKSSKHSKRSSRWEAEDSRESSNGRREEKRSHRALDVELKKEHEIKKEESEDDNPKIEKIRLRGEKKEEDAAKREVEEQRMAALKAKYDEWGSGLVQNQKKMDKFESDLYEMSKPLARFKDDDDLDQMLREKVYAEDPMLDYIKKKKKKTENPEETIPRYSGPAPAPNRFNIWPGYRWDGVDRSNGFEKRYFASINNKASKDNESYMWSVQEM